jgi:hypothetical protein
MSTILDDEERQLLIDMLTNKLISMKPYGERAGLYAARLIALRRKLEGTDKRVIVESV